jgi:hypothetical protein
LERDKGKGREVMVEETNKRVGEIVREKGEKEVNIGKG